MHPKTHDDCEVVDFFRKMYLVISVLPAASVLALYVYAANVALVIGHWPYYGHPDPKDLPAPFALWHATVLLTTWVGMLALPTWLGFLPLAIRVLRTRALLAVIVFAFASGLATIQATYDPAGVSEWYID